ncbi:MAG: hypothetical protein WBR56_16930, partial [Sedimenticolaceae bacterium]
MPEVTRAGFPVRTAAGDAGDLRPLRWTYVPVVLLALIGVSITIFLFAQSVDRVKREVEIKFREASHDRIL